jgi:hypothetical protein
VDCAVFVKPVAVPSAAFAFCRWTLAITLWAALLLRQPGLVAVTAVVLGVSALLGVGRAPLVVLWKLTLHRVIPTRDAILNEHAMRFAHALGALLAAVTYVFLLLAPTVGRAGLILLVAVKTIGALGFCPAGKLYECVVGGGGCCGLLGKKPDV